MPSISRSSLRVKHGELYFKTAINNAWTALHSDNPRTFLGKETISDIEFHGGITIAQHIPTDAVFADWRWIVSFDAHQIHDIHVSEFSRPGTDNWRWAAIQFKCSQAPYGRVFPVATMNPQEKLSLAIAPAPYSAFSIASQLPIARLSNNFDDDQYTELLIVFKFPLLKGKKGTRGWSWPTATTLLTGVTPWWSPSTKEQTELLDRMSLAEHAADLQSGTSTINLVSAGSGYWVTGANAPLPTSEPSALPSAITGASSSSMMDSGIEEQETAIGKRKLEEVVNEEGALSDKKKELYGKRQKQEKEE